MHEPDEEGSLGVLEVVQRGSQDRREASSTALSDLERLAARGSRQRSRATDPLRVAAEANAPQREAVVTLRPVIQIFRLFFPICDPKERYRRGWDGTQLRVAHEGYRPRQTV